MGGYSLSGRAWRLQLPPGHPLRGHPGVNNLLEFTASMVVNIWLECLDSKSEHDCILAVGDSTSAIGWLFKTSGFSSADNEHAAQHLATILIKNGKCLASQHLRGELNVLADLLSFAGISERGKAHPLAADDPPNDVLSHRFRHHLTFQVPANFRISQLPAEVLFWVTQVLRTATSSLGAAKKGGMKTPTGRGDDGKDSARARATAMIPISLCYPSSNANFSSKLFCSATVPRIGPEAGTLQACVRDRWFRALCDKPQATWLRRFGAISGEAPCTSREARTCNPSSDPCSRPTATRTHPRSNNGP